MRPRQWWAESGPHPGWNKVKVSENLGATGRPCGYIPEGPSYFVTILLTRLQ